MSDYNLAGLSASCHEQFVEWRQARKPQEEKMRRMYDDMMRIQRDEDTGGTGISKAQKSKVFIGSTRSKIRSARAKIKDVLFGSGKMPFDTEPTNEDLKEFSDAMEDILTYQLREMKFPRTIGQGIDSIATYGTSFIFGPFVKTKTHTAVMQTADGLAEQTIEYKCPYFEHGRTMDVYPDPEAENEIDGRGVYWAALKLPSFIKGLKGKPGYSDEAIDRAATETVSGYQSEGSDLTEADRKNLYRYTKEGRVWFVRFFGRVSKQEFKNWKSSNKTAQTSQEMQPSTNDELVDPVDTVEAIITMAGGYVIKAEENPYKDQRRPSFRCVYEDVEHEMWGVGIAENNDPNQRVVNAAFRLFLEGKAMALLKTFSADRSSFEASEDFKIFPGKRYAMKPGLNPEERKTAIIWHDVADVTQGWQDVIGLAEKFSDDDTGVTKYTQGDDAEHLNDTATGISMIMNASALPLKEVISNIDEMWIEELIESLIQWNIEYLEPETVKVLIGEEQASVWAKIKQYGKTNFMDWYATGSKTFMAKEVLMHKLQGFLQIVLGSEPAMQQVKLPELLQQVWDSGQIGEQSPIISPEEREKEQNGQAEQAINELKQEANKRIKMLEDALNQAKATIQTAKLQAQAKDAEMKALKVDLEHKHGMDMAELEKKNAEIDKLQAETVKTLAEAAIVPSQAMVEEAANVEGASSDPDAATERGELNMAAPEAGTEPMESGLDSQADIGGLPGNAGQDQAVE